MSRKKINDGLTKWKRWAINHPEMARASYLAKGYRREDKKRNNGNPLLMLEEMVLTLVIKLQMESEIKTKDMCGNIGLKK